MNEQAEAPSLEQEIMEWRNELVRLLNKASMKRFPQWAIEGALRDELAVIDVIRERRASSTVEQQSSLKRLIDAGIQP